MEKKNLRTELIIIFWLFVIGSILGHIFEMIIVLFQKGHFETRQGLIYGPFIPVYGIGAIIYYLILNNINTENKIKVFFITAILGGMTEYLSSFIQEKAFGTISWDYSYLLFNINGRTSLLHCTYWGIAGILYVTYIDPFLEKLKQKTNEKSLKIATIIFSIFMIFNISISCVAANRQLDRRNNIAPKNRLDIFLDKHYPDEYMNKIFSNKREV